MQKIALITDSACDLPEEILKRFEIHLLPLRVIFKDAEFLDRVNITAQEFYEKLHLEVPKTSLPSMEDALKVLNKLKAEGFTHVLAMHLSSGLSGTFNMMRNVAKDFNDMFIEVIDTKTLSMGLGFIVLEAAKQVEDLQDFETVVQKIKGKIDQIKEFFVLPSLEYLIKGGRIGRVSGTIGELMQIKPIISVDDKDGTYFNYDKVRGRKQSLTRLFEIVKEKTENKLSEVAVLHGAAESEAKELLEKVKQLPFVKDTIFSDISPALSVHTGPGLVAVVVNNLE